MTSSLFVTYFKETPLEVLSILQAFVIIASLVAKLWRKGKGEIGPSAVRKDTHTCT